VNVRKPVPMHAVPTRVRCPVCGEVSYSATGMHPQCAAIRADKVLRALHKANSAAVELPAARKAWSKFCPKCKRQMPSRRFRCDCGHNFGPTPADRATD
jgi:hypothetical protein